MADYIGINVPTPLAVNQPITTTGTTSVICSGGDFVNMGVKVGDTVLNTTDTEFTTVTDVVSATELTVSPAGTFAQASDEICVLSGTKNTLIPVKTGVILSINTEAFASHNRLDLRLMTNETSSDYMKVYIENGGTTAVSEGNKITESFINSVSNVLAKGYQPNIVSTLALPNGARYAYVALEAS